MKGLREHCHVSLPTLFYVALQKRMVGTCDATVEFGKEGHYGAAADGDLAEETLLLSLPSMHCPLSKCDSWVKPAGVPYKDAQFSYVLRARRGNTLL